MRTSASDCRTIAIYESRNCGGICALSRLPKKSAGRACAEFVVGERGATAKLDLSYRGGLGASALVVAGAHVEPLHSHGSDNLRGPATGAAAAASTAVELTS